VRSHDTHSSRDSAGQQSPPRRNPPPLMAHPSLHLLHSSHTMSPQPTNSGGGFIIPFFLGVVDVLQRQGILTPIVPIAGASSGALVAM
jgi:hypothetical protein